MEWIELVDRTPEKEQEVIVYFKNSAGWHTTAAYWDGENFTERCEDCGNQTPFTYQTPITHWMPLPEPPKK